MMMGSLVSLTGYLMVLGLLNLWAVFKVARGGHYFTALLMFLFWPASLYALVRFWGDEDSDVRIPVLMSFVTLGMVLFMANRVVEKTQDQLVLEFSDEEMALLWELDPELAQQAEMRRMGLIEEGELTMEEFLELHADDPLVQDYVASGYDRPGRRVPQRETVETFTPGPVTAPVERTPDEIEADRRRQLRMAADGLAWRFGTVALGETGASLSLPQNFRFATRDTLPRLARLRGEPLDPEVLGWVAHRRSDLAGDQGWFVEVRTTTLTRPFPLRPIADQGVVPQWLRASGVADPEALARGPLAADWDGERFIARWSERPSDDAPAQYAALLPAAGQPLRLSMRNVDPDHHELAERAIRLIASRISIP